MSKLTPNQKEALHIAIAAIYFNDSSDYESALWSIVKELGGEEAIKDLEKNPSEAFRKYHTDPSSLD